ncbi:Conidiation protein 6-domain-containing protein [Daedaleopsis nitida]|nr:Conidiation protein 6-domain-containing protein [Daedaleopsis nitida]
MLIRPLVPTDTRVAAGLKAAIHNPNVSEQAKERAQDRLENMNASIPTERDSAFPVGTTDTNGHEINRVLGGYKATLHNPNVSSQAKEHAREVLGEVDGDSGTTQDEHQMHVNAGYKAALHNPNVSREAKAHAREYLEEHGEL